MNEETYTDASNLLNIGFLITQYLIEHPDAMEAFGTWINSDPHITVVGPENSTDDFLVVLKSDIIVANERFYVAGRKAQLMQSLTTAFSFLHDAFMGPDMGNADHEDYAQTDETDETNPDKYVSADNLPRPEMN